MKKNRPAPENKHRPAGQHNLKSGRLVAIAGMAIRLTVESAGDVIVDGAGGNRQRRDNACYGHCGQQPEYDDRTPDIGGGAGNGGGRGVPGMIESLVTADTPSE